MIEDLKRRVAEVDDKCLAIDMAYQTPEEVQKPYTNQSHT
jgi:hypothetical protein